MSFASCVNLRYTDYGKPFDFLKAKNNYHKVSKTAIDTAGICRTDGGDNLVGLIKKENGIEKVEEETITPENFVSEVVEVPTQMVNESLISNEEIVVELKAESYTTLRPMVKEQVKLKPRSSISQSTPPEWWSNMWKNFFKFFLLWILIAFATVAAIYGLILGITALALWIGGPTVAAITCVVLFIVVQVVFDIDLSWLFFLL